MSKNKNVLYVLTAALATSSLAAGIAVADNEYYDYGTVSEQVIVEQSGVQMPQVVYEEETVMPATAVAYEQQPIVVAQEEDNGVPPKDKDGSLFPGGSCSSCAKDKDGSLFGGKPCHGCSKENAMVPGPCYQCEARQAEMVALRDYVPYTPVVYEAVQKNCCQMGTIALDHVDFRIKNNGVDGPYSSKLGNYRFRIFGCRRFNKEASLNSGRIMEKNINFQSVFEEAVDDCYKVLPMPKDLCLQTVPAETPEYVLTAEITDYFMNVCDEYDWNKSEKKETRTGSSEITVVWRLMDLTKNKIYWKGESTGYGELYYGEKNGEVKLIERAFSDASSNLRGLTGFEEQLMQRKTMQEMAAERYALIEEERAINPLKCGYRKQYECVKSCEIGRPGAMLNQCCDCAPACETGDCVTEKAPVIESCVDENGQIIENGACQVVDDTWIDTGDVKSLENLCIIATDPCKALTPETMYRMRSSVVEINGSNGRKGAGLLISDQFILTSGDLIDSNNNYYTVKTIRGAEMGARAVRVNPSKNTALLMLDKPTEYTPLALNLSLPEVGTDGFLTMGVLDVPNFKEGQDYLENSARIEGYRYTKEKGAEILVNTFIQNVTVGGALFHKTCTVGGMAHSGIRTDDGLDVYVPTEIALRSLGISICGHEYIEESPWQQTIYKPVTEQIEIIQQAPEEMSVKDRK
ncbi:MAG: hypothetical protein IJ532_03010 [Alphaproteobacteria bacterium]|nr:hypothetical protein [Alphaproteobacteria bacterium]